VKFKIDENLPIEFAEILQAAGDDATTVFDEELQGERDSIIGDICRLEGRILVTLDTDSADIRAYPPTDFPGFLVLRVQRQDKPFLISIFQGIIPLLSCSVFKRLKENL
jgi:predicted nuclease of predicted toxin-antitoxin system